jgi:hypothetical protein
MSRIVGELREQVRQRAYLRCEYCLMPEGYYPHRHQADHIIPQKHAGTDELKNLAWACFPCNVRKGTDISAYDEKTMALTPLFNPRTQVWNEHFTLQDDRILGETDVGRVTVKLFHMNDADQIALRKALREAGMGLAD